MNDKFIEYCDQFATIDSDQQSRAFQLFPNIYSDDRGSFTEVLKDFGQWPHKDIPLWFSNLDWISQVNRSVSTTNVCRGMHAQQKQFCQAKLVECVNGSVYDLILDARPDSKTFGLFDYFRLDSTRSNKLFVPKGFLHGFYVPELDSNGNSNNNCIFQYFISGGTYSHENEVSINIQTVLVEARKYISLDFIKEDVILSDKDKSGVDYNIWMKQVDDEYKKTGKVWYR